MSGFRFPDDFLWGAATASYQVEGAVREGGRGSSIWDDFCRVPGRVHAGENGDVSCDQYHRFKEDVGLLRKLGAKAYRFSIAWPRIMPSGTGEANAEGVAYYLRLIAELEAAGIEPVATLYHWDLPSPLQAAGGWANRATAAAFEAYARACFKAFGGRIKTWITLNEPYCAAYLGYLWGIHAPGIADPAQAYAAVHHLNLAHGLAVKAFRASGAPGRIGIVWNLQTPRPATRSADDLRAVERVLDHESRMFAGPVLGKGYPAGLLRDARIDLPVAAGDMEAIAAPIDFIGLNYYNERAVTADGWTEGVLPPTVPSWERHTEMDWPVVPRGLYRQLRWVAAEAPGVPLYIMENGSAEADVPVPAPDGTKRVHDAGRVDYLRSHFRACSDAIADGVPLAGYFVWSFIDNFEWAFGYTKRFGIVYCDFQTLERIPKDSYYYYRDVIAGYGD